MLSQRHAIVSEEAEAMERGYVLTVFESSTSRFQSKLSVASTLDMLTLLRERLLKCFMDIVTLRKLRDHGALVGYAVVKSMRHDYGVSVDPPKVYSMLRCLEKDGLVRCFYKGKKKFYSLTPKGKSKIESLIKSRKRIEQILEKIL